MMGMKEAMAGTDEAVVDQEDAKMRGNQKLNAAVGWRG